MIFILSDSPEACPILPGTQAVSGFDQIPEGSKVVLFSFGKLITADTLSKYEVYNVHNSLLPKYRGLHAFSWAIINGETEVGYTFHKVNEGIDSGAIGGQLHIALAPDEDVNDAFAKAAQMMSGWLATMIEKLANGDLEFREQDESQATYVGRRKAQDGEINWDDKAENIHNLIRAVAPPYTPGAFTTFKGEPLRIKKSSLTSNPEYIGISGQVVGRFPGKGLLVKTGDSTLLIERVTFKEEEMCASELFKTVGHRF